jgi:hypothetical protein
MGFKFVQMKHGILLQAEINDKRIRISIKLGTNYPRQWEIQVGSNKRLGPTTIN